MRIGILQCDDVADELRPDFGNYPAMFESKLREACAEFQFTTYPVMLGRLPQSVEECDGYLVTGSRHGVNDELEWIGRLEKFVRLLAGTRQKYVGICFGHQVLATALGGEVAVAEQGWGVGITTNRIDVEKAWMRPPQSSLKLVVSHRDQVCRLPQGMEVLASSSFCP